MEDFDADRVNQPLPRTSGPSLLDQYGSDPLVQSTGLSLLGPLGPALGVGYKELQAAGPAVTGALGGMASATGDAIGSPLLQRAGGWLSDQTQQWRDYNASQAQRPGLPVPVPVLSPSPVVDTSGMPAPWELPREPVTPKPQPSTPRPVVPGQSRPAAPAQPSALDAAYKGQLDASDASTKADLGLAKAQAEHDQAQAQREAEGLKLSQDRRDAVSKEYNARLAATERVSQDLEGAAADPNRLWNNLSGAQKIQGVVAMALHGLGDAFRGTHTEDPLTKAINADIQQQREVIESKKAGLANRMNFMKMYREAGLSDAEAEAETRKQILQLASKHVDQTLLNAKNEGMIANGQKLKAKLADDYAKASDEAETHRMQRSNMAAEIRLKNAQAAAAGQKASALDPKMTVQLPDGRTVVAPTEKDAETLRNQIAQGKSYKATLDQIVKTSPGLGARLLATVGIDTPATANFNALAQSGVDKFRPATSGSTAEMGDPSQRALRSTMAKGLFESDAEYQARMRAMAAQADVGLNSTLQSLGQAPIIGFTPNSTPKR